MEIAEALQVDGATLPATLKNPDQMADGSSRSKRNAPRLWIRGRVIAQARHGLGDTLQEEQTAVLNGYVLRSRLKNLGKAADR